MDKNTTLKLKMTIELENGLGIHIDGEETVENLARICRKELKKGGGCPVGNVLGCPFYYKPYMKRHEGERPIFCESVKAEDWVELFSVLKEEC